MNKSVLALSTALTIFAATQAIAQTATPDPACVDQATGAVKTNDPNCNPDGTMKNAAGSNTGSATTTTTTTAPSTDTTTTAPATDTTTTNTTATTNTTVAGSGSLTVPADVLNSAKVMSANDYIGKTVYDTNNANIGEVNDLIMSTDGKIAAVILGVGGFLGIGEKNVAVPVASIKMMDDDADGTVTTDTTTTTGTTTTTTDGTTTATNNAPVVDANDVKLVVEASKEQLEAAPSYDIANRRYITDDTTTGSTTTAPAPATNTQQ
jgi:sporulation protein YlmC with PRC-barrel domain